jgi:hypothetical protein
MGVCGPQVSDTALAPMYETSESAQDFDITGE